MPARRCREGPAARSRGRNFLFMNQEAIQKAVLVLQHVKRLDQERNALEERIGRLLLELGPAGASGPLVDGEHHVLACACYARGARAPEAYRVNTHRKDMRLHVLCISATQQCRAHSCSARQRAPACSQHRTSPPAASSHVSLPSSLPPSTLPPPQRKASLVLTLTSMQCAPCATSWPARAPTWVSRTTSSKRRLLHCTPAAQRPCLQLQR